MKRVLAVLLIVLAAAFAVACTNTPTAPSAPSTPTVVAAPVISQFTVDAVNPRLLVWTVTGGGNLQVRILPVVGDVQAIGSQVVAPDTYTIQARNEGGTVSRSVQVK